MKKVIWSLFDSETAITQELNSEKYIVYSIGLPSSSAITNNFIKIVYISIIHIIDMFQI